MGIAPLSPLEVAESVFRKILGSFWGISKRDVLMVLLGKL
jgi:hypothetical protein